MKLIGNRTVFYFVINESHLELKKTTVVSGLRYLFPAISCLEIRFNFHSIFIKTLCVAKKKVVIHIFFNKRTFQLDVSANKKELIHVSVNSQLGFDNSVTRVKL